VDVGGLPLGAFDTAEYEERVLALNAGDLLVFHTDGLTEARASGREYGMERLRAQVEAHAALPAAEVAARIVADLDRFLDSGAPGDDVTLVVVRAVTDHARGGGPARA
jgi:sigma-B regulation protein RsbU (phosphoserine phosphatase)